MKKLFIFFIFAICSVFIAYADTISLNWWVDNTRYAQTTCQSGGTLSLPSPTPTKYGYTFVGWNRTYTELEYIESTGTQWIDTGIVPNTTMSVKFSVATTDIHNNSVIFGSRTSGTYSTSTDQFYGGVNDSSAHLYTVSGLQFTTHEDNPQENVFYEVTGTNTTQTATSTQPMYLFALNRLGDRGCFRKNKTQIFEVI